MICPNCLGGWSIDRNMRPVRLAPSPGHVSQCGPWLAWFDPDDMSVYQVFSRTNLAITISVEVDTRSDSSNEVS